jgi:hypothetical protein
MIFQRCAAKSLLTVLIIAEIRPREQLRAAASRFWVRPVGLSLIRSTIICRLGFDFVPLKYSVGGEASTSTIASLMDSPDPHRSIFG